jgi:protein-disulfide isomerase
MGKQARIQSREIRQARVAAEQRARKHNRMLAGGGLIIVGLLVAIVITLVNAAGGDDPAGTGEKKVVSPAGATVAGALVLGNASAPVKVEVYLDYMCPYCGRFERANSNELERLTADGTVRLELYPLSFLDRTSQGTRYSTRAANAIATVADRAPDRVLAFNTALFANQPEEGGRGLGDEQISNLATGAGVPQDVVNLFADRIFEPWIAKLTETAFKSGGITGTPTVKVNGSVFKGDLYTAGPLSHAITAAKGEK